MMFAKKCPKCAGEVQTKIIKKSIGLGKVDIPVAQFCLNPTCDWYQDFTDSRKSEELKEDIFQIKVPSIKNLSGIKKASFTRSFVIAFGVIIAAILILLLINFMASQSQIKQEPDAVPQEIPHIKISASPTTGIPSPAPRSSAIIETPIPVSKENSPTISQTVTVRIDVGHGFIPGVANINRSDRIVWINQENQRSRIYLISKDNLFEKKLMEYTDRFSYQFNQSGNFSFALAESPSMNEYPDATGIVTVK